MHESVLDQETLLINNDVPQQSADRFIDHAWNTARAIGRHHIFGPLAKVALVLSVAEGAAACNNTNAAAETPAATASVSTPSISTSIATPTLTAETPTQTQEPIILSGPVELQPVTMHLDPIKGVEGGSAALRVQAEDPATAAVKLFQRIRDWNSAANGATDNEMVHYDPSKNPNSVVQPGETFAWPKDLGATVGPEYFNAIFGAPGEDVSKTPNAIQYMNTTNLGFKIYENSVVNMEDPYVRSLGYEFLGNTEKSPKQVDVNTWEMQVELWDWDNMPVGKPLPNGTTTKPLTRDNNERPVDFFVTKDSDGSWHIDFDKGNFFNPDNK